MQNILIKICHIISWSQWDILTGNVYSKDFAAKLLFQL